ncbi:MAG: CapA family protein [Bacteroidales bacterium]
MNIRILNDMALLDKNRREESLGLLFTGDFYPHRSARSLILQNDYQALFNDFLPVLHKADMVVTNLECPLTDREREINKSGPALKAPPATAKALRYGNIEIACLANNHIMDYGNEGLIDTLQYLNAAEIKYVGAGNSLNQARKPLIINKKGHRIGIINICEHEFSIASDHTAGAAPIDEITNYYQIKDIRSNTDLIILIIHGGHEMYPFPSPRMVKLYRFYADLGVDVIIGHHPHVFSGYEIYHGVPIFYSLGNFLFDAPERSDMWYRGFTVYLKISEKSISEIFLIPYSQFADGYGIRLLNIKETGEFENIISEYNQVIAHDTKLQEQFQQYSRIQRKNYLAVFLSNSRYKRKLLHIKIFQRLFFKRIRLLRLLNQFRCQAHRDVMTEILENEVRTN